MSTFIPRLHVGGGTQRGALTLFPVWVEGAGTPGLGWTKRDLHVEERAGNAVVSELIVRNAGDRPRAVIEGDLFIGGQQDRMAADTFVLEPGESLVVPVRCVEHGRWDGESRHRATSLRSPYSVRFGRHSGTAALNDQGEVWSRIAEIERRRGETGTQALTEHMHLSRGLRSGAARGSSGARSGRIETPIDLRGLRPISGQRGVIIGIGGRVAAAEIFGSEFGLRTRWEGVLDAAALDAGGGEPVATPSAKAREFAERIELAPRRDESSARGIRRIALRDARTAVGTEWTTDAGGRRRGLLHLTAYNRAHPVLALA